MLDGHCPRDITKAKSWTAEEWQKFCYPVAEVLLTDLPDQEYHYVWLTARIVELLFHRKNGLKEEELNDLHQICWRRIILLEEEVGKEQCVITCHNSLHMKDDILRFGPLDNFSCFGPERAVKRYDQQSLCV